MNRRSFILSTAMASLIWPAASGTQALAADHPAVKFTRKVADDLIRAQMIGTVPRFTAVIRRHADVPHMAMQTLGPYRSKLPSSKRQQYYKGITAYIAHYFANQTRKYRVLQAKVKGAAKDGDTIAVDAIATLEDGSNHTVRFILRPAGKSYKVTDVKISYIAWISLVSGMRGDVQRFLAKKGGDVNALIAALNR